MTKPSTHGPARDIQYPNDNRPRKVIWKTSVSCPLLCNKSPQNVEASNNNKHLLPHSFSGPGFAAVYLGSLVWISHEAAVNTPARLPASDSLTGAGGARPKQVTHTTSELVLMADRKFQALAATCQPCEGVTWVSLSSHWLLHRLFPQSEQSKSVQSKRGYAWII